MRSSRLAKHRKKHKTISKIAKVFVLGYAILLSMSLLTTNTSAYLSNNDQTAPSISTSKEWWDKSNLTFAGTSDGDMESCQKGNISAQLKNKGLDMYDTTAYEVYYSEKGDPKKQGKKIADGIIKPIKQGDTATIKFHADTDHAGNYIFKVMQRPYYDNEDSIQAIWSEKITVNCKDENKPKQNKQDETKDSNAAKQDENTDQSQTTADKPKSNDVKDSQENKSQGNTDKIENAKPEQNTAGTSGKDQQADKSEGKSQNAEHAAVTNEKDSGKSQKIMEPSEKSRKTINHSDEKVNKGDKKNEEIQQNESNVEVD